jgi:methyltransferase (TIGR00027 family)
MKLPNLSYMMSVGELRYIQSHFETGEYRNPDFAVGTFLSLSKRLRCALRGTALLARARSNPFYSYVLARTKYYDEVFLDAIYSSCRRIVNVGCGSDTRAYRFAHILKQKGVSVVECDQEEAIRAKEEIARRHWPTDHVTYLPLDLGGHGWPSFERVLEDSRAAPALVMLEGVSPYLGEESFKAFLRMLADRLHPQSAIAYDYKLAGVADGFGAAGAGERRYRLTGDRQAVVDHHRPLGLEVRHLELGSALCRRLLPQVVSPFEEDVLVRLVPASGLETR